MSTTSISSESLLSNPADISRIDSDQTDLSASGYSTTRTASSTLSQKVREHCRDIELYLKTGLTPEDIQSAIEVIPSYQLDLDACGESDRCGKIADFNAEMQSFGKALKAAGDNQLASFDERIESAMDASVFGIEPSSEFVEEIHNDREKYIESAFFDHQRALNRGDCSAHQVIQEFFYDKESPHERLSLQKPLTYQEENPSLEQLTKNQRSTCLAAASKIKAFADAMAIDPSDFIRNSVVSPRTQKNLLGALLQIDPLEDIHHLY